MPDITVSRRGLIAGVAAGGGLLVAWSLLPRSFAPTLEPGRGEHAFNAWLKIGEDGVVTVAVPQLEMGQGVTTILPQIIAVELGADWRQIAVEPVPPSGAYPNIPLASKWSQLWHGMLPNIGEGLEDYRARRFAESERFNLTADGTSLEAYEGPCRLAAATARGMLAEAAAERWDVAPEECVVSAGFVTHGERRASFGELVSEAALLDPPDPPPLRPTAFSEEPLPGEGEGESAFPRLDLPAKVGGNLLFAGDIRLPDMVYAAIRHAPHGDSELVDFDANTAASTEGFVGAVKAKRWLAAVGNSWWSANLALDAMRPRFRSLQPVDSVAMESRLSQAIETGEASRVSERGEPDELLVTPSMAARYDVHPALHAPLETASATARLVDGRLELWIASQAPEQARIAAGRAIGLSPEDVVLYPVAAGGSFDRRLENDHAIEVAILSQEIGRPVQLTWSRWQEHLMTRPSPPVAARLSANVIEGEGAISAWQARLALPPVMHEFGERLFDNATAVAAIERSEGKADPLACEGAFPIYDIPHVALDHVPLSLPLAAGRMRGNAHRYTAFFTESFIDEIAARHGKERLSYRISMLAGDTRMVGCLRRTAAIAGWEGGNVGQGGQGLACHRIGSREAGGRIACIAEARMGEGGIVVDRLTAAVDIGRIVNLDIARQQIEGGLLFGLSLALAPKLDYERGLPGVRRLSDMRIPRLAQCPEITVDFLSSDEPAADPGELGVAVVAPALANAIYAATGNRYRTLPLLAGDPV
ncbi:molybdopterin cofactor-binding domain-containing protein [Altererythrobacter sp. MF3-039]|uniref:molybdopterin cofactor-binding domain-containing protein n=1 Tax=Altererythrobacter sp. MF3-039 TaxID=3252901 RepID=UPI00390C9C87